MDSPTAWRIFLGVFGAVLVVDAAYHLVGARIWYSDCGPLPDKDWRQLRSMGVSLFRAGCLANKAPAICFAYLVLAAAMAATGWSFLSVPIFIVVASLHERNRVIGYSGDALIRMLLVTCVVVTLLSITAPARRDAVAALGLFTVQLTVFVVYFYAGLHKLRSRSWRNGTALALALGNAGIARFSATATRAFRRYTKWISPQVLAFELLWPALVLSGFQGFALVLAMAFHLGIWILLCVHLFSLIMIAALTAFLFPWRAPTSAEFTLLLWPFLFFWCHLLFWDNPVSLGLRGRYRRLVGRFVRAASLDHRWDVFSSQYPAASWSQISVYVLEQNDVHKLRWPEDIDPMLVGPAHRCRTRNFVAELGGPNKAVRGAFVDYVWRQVLRRVPSARGVGVVHQRVPSDVDTATREACREVFDDGRSTYTRPTLLGIRLLPSGAESTYCISSALTRFVSRTLTSSAREAEPELKMYTVAVPEA